jgi:hypothetical protein
MALTTYAELQTAVANWLARDDLAASVPDFITLFEACANRKLRVRQMETTATLAPSAGSAALPSDYLSWRRVTWTGSTRVELDYVEPSWLQAAYPDTPAGRPRVFTIEGGTLKIAPADGGALEFNYYQKVAPLSAAVNWLYAAHPDIYLFGALTEAQGFNLDTEKLALWKARRDEIFAEIESLSKKTQGGGAIRTVGTIV